jgi:hypothetical protein
LEKLQKRAERFGLPSKVAVTEEKV